MAQILAKTKRFNLRVYYIHMYKNAIVVLRNYIKLAYYDLEGTKWK